ncbi:MAG: phosphatidylglycerophosphatase A [Gammaproteobacteria bacterium]|nr:phosphatidylglycerophosphatase A [Gammaproteobacteria bacterium]
MNQPNFKTLWSRPIQCLAFGFGAGLSPKAPGTIGTLIAIPIWWALIQFSFTFYLIASIFIAIVGIYICQRAAEQLGVHDHGGIVWDEISGFLLTMLFLPPTWQAVVAGFLAFRLFDIVKPWPISWCDRNVKGGFGIMLDDWLAGLLAGFLIFLLQYYCHCLF